MDNQSDLSPKISSDGELTKDEAQRWAAIIGLPIVEEEPLPPRKLRRPAEPNEQGIRYDVVFMWLLVSGFVVLCGIAVISGDSSVPELGDDVTDTVSAPTIDPTVDYLSRNDTGQSPVELIDGVEMVFVPARCNPEGPCFTTSFWIDRYEVSNEQAGLQGDNIFPLRPSVNVSRSEAQGFCAERGGRLPTAQEWEYAASGVEQWQYPWGDNFEDGIANICDRQCLLENRDENYNDGYEQVSKITRFESGASWVGALNMGGNVAEWIQSRDTFLNIGQLRGGSWAADKDSITTTYTELVNKDYRNDRIGFRCVMDRVVSN